VKKLDMLKKRQELNAEKRKSGAKGPGPPSPVPKVKPSPKPKADKLEVPEEENKEKVLPKASPQHFKGASPRGPDQHV